MPCKRFSPDMSDFMEESLGMCRGRCPHRPAGLLKDNDFLGQPHGNRPAEGFCGIFCIMFQLHRRIPQSACGCQLPFQGSLSTNEPPLKRVTPHGVGRCPQGRGDRSVRGGPPLGGGGVHLQSVTSSAATPKPSGGIRSFLAVRLGLANAGCR